MATNNPAAVGTADTKTTGEERLSDILSRLPLFEGVRRRKLLTPEQLEIVLREEAEDRAKDDEKRKIEEAEADRRRANGDMAALANQLGERYHPNRCSLESFRITSREKQQPVIDRLREIGADLTTFTRGGHGLVFIGSVGTGKDHLAASMLYTAIREFRISSKWVNGRGIFQASRDAIRNDQAESEMIEPFLAPAILCISDPVPVGGSLTSWNVDLLYRVIDMRYRRMRPTWMTLNVQTPEEADRCLTPPVWDRLRDGAELVRCFWSSFRRESRQ